VTDFSVAAVSEIVRAIRRLLDQGTDTLLVAIDGHSGAGKSRLAADVAAEVEGVVVDSDDFYAGDPASEWDARTVADDAERCIDWWRLRREALEPLLARRAAAWHPYDWETGGGLVPQLTSRQPASIVILDGVYSARPELADLVSLSILVEAPPEVRRARVARRDGDIDAWYERWDAAERHYLTHVRPPGSFDLVVANAEPLE
jgi:uridine kinase